MKKSIAFLGALLFGSVTFGQVTKNDTIKKPTSRKVSSDDMKKFPEDTETTASAGNIKFKASEKHSSDASAGTSEKIRGGTQKGGTAVSSATTEKQHYTIKLTNASKKAAEDGVEPIVIKENTATTQKKHISNVKWSGDKVAKDTLPKPTSSTSKQFIKIGDIKGEKNK